MYDNDDNLPPEPGFVTDECLGLTDDEAGNPSHEPPLDDEELGDIEIIEGDGSYIDEEDSP